MELFSAIFRMYVLFNVQLFIRGVEAQPTFTQKPLSPQNVTEGENVTLIWTYNLDGTLEQAQLRKVASDGKTTVIVNKYPTNNPTITNDFKDRFHVQIISDTETSMTITAIPRSDSGTYQYQITNNNFDGDTSEVEISVLYTPNITTFFAGNQTLNESDTLDLICAADGNPTPSITWIRLSDNSPVNSPLTITGKQDEGEYRCTASNGVGSPDNRTVYIAVPNYHPIDTTVTTNVADNTVVVNTTFSIICSAQANPTAMYRFYKGKEYLNDTKNDAVITTSVSERVKEVKYSCIPFNFYGDGPARVVTVTVHFPPSVSISNTTVTAIEGSSLSFKCNEFGRPKPNITWTKVGSSKVLSYNSSVTVNVSRPGTPDNMVQYQCTASNGVGTPATATVDVDVQYKPDSVFLKTNLTTDKACDILWVNFTCTSSEANPPVQKYRLYEYQGDNLWSTRESLQGNWIHDISLEGNWTYNCQASQTLKNTTSANNVTLVVNTNAYVAPLDNRSYSEYSNVKVICNTSGTPNPAVIWTKLNDNSGRQWLGKTLNFSSIGIDDEGEYKCEAVSDVCSNDSKTTFITVLYKPKNVTLELNITTANICNDSIVAFTCGAEANPEVEYFQLYENNSKILNTSSSGVWNKPMSEEGEFSYSCVAKNSEGTGKSNIVDVTVSVPAAITYVKNHSVVEGSDLHLVCNVSGSSPTVVWTKNNGDKRYDKIWIIRNITKYDGGSYTCDVNNSCNSDSKSIYVNVKYAPYITIGNRAISVSVEDRASLVCPIRGNPQPNITWYEGNGTDPDTRINGTSRTLEISNTSFEDRGWYTCSAANFLGRETVSVQLLVERGFYLTATINEKCSKRLEVAEEFPKECCKWLEGEGCVSGRSTEARCGSVIVDFFLKFNQDISASTVVSLLKKAAKENSLGAFIVDPDSIKQISSQPTERTSTESTITTATTTKDQGCVESFVKDSNCEIKWVIVGIIIGVIVALVVVVIVIVWWVHKKRKCRKDTRVCDSSPDVQPLSEGNRYAKVNNGYAKSGPLPTADNIEVEQPQGAAGAAAIPTYAVVDKSKKKDKKKDKKASEQKPPEDQYAVVDKSKKKKKKNEPDATYAEVDMSKKSKKPPKHKPDEVLYADLGNFHQMKEMPEVSTSPKALPPIKRPEPYAETQYADITQFLKGNTDPPKEGATLPDSNSSQAPAAGSKEESSAGNTGEGAKANEETLL